MNQLILFSMMAFQPPGTTSAIAPAPLNSFLMAGAVANASTTPHPGGFGAYGTPIASDKLSWSMYSGSVSLVGGKPVVTSQATTGIAQRVCSMTLGSVHVSCWLIGALGPGQAGAVTSLAMDAGGGLSWEHLSKRWPGLFGWTGYLQSKVASVSQGEIMIGGGYAWK